MSLSHRSSGGILSSVLKNDRLMPIVTTAAAAGVVLYTYYSITKIDRSQKKRAAELGLKEIPSPDCSYPYVGEHRETNSGTMERTRL